MPYSTRIARCLWLLAGLVLALPPHPAAATASLDYTWIINRLKEDGISPSRISWGQIEALCQPIRSGNDAYQRCRLEKAQLQANYQDDAETCTDTALAFHPNTLRYQAVLVDSVATAQSASTLALLNTTTPAVANNDAFQRHLFNQCMREHGWKNPRDYRRGTLNF